MSDAPLSRSTIQEMSQLLSTAAVSNLMADGHVSFVAFAIGRNRSLTPILLETVDMQQKEALGRMLRLLAPHAGAIAIICESWYVETTAASTALDIRPSEHEGRKESILVTVSSPHGDLVANIPFERDSTGKPVEPKQITAQWQSLRGVQMNLSGFYNV